MQVSRAHPLLQRMDRFLYSPAYFLFLGGLTVLSNVFGLEIYVYTAYVLTGICICLFGRDLLPIFPIFACGYISPSKDNNPGLNEDSVFSLSGGGVYLGIILALLAASLIYRLVTDPDFGGKKFLTKKRKLMSGILLLSATYAISGIASGQWAEFGWRNLLFSFVQLVAVGGLYYLLSGAVKWDQAPEDYLPWTGICVGYVLLAEMIHIYVGSNAIVDGAIFRDVINTGWGHYNSIGALLTLIIPLPFLLTAKKHVAGFAYFSALLFLVILLFTCSRGSILVGTVIYVAGYILSLFHSRRARRQIVCHVVVAVLLILLLTLFRERIMHLFSVLWDAGLHSPERMETYREGFKQFLQFPVFGGSFFPVDFWPYAWATAEGFAFLFPPRWHNTLVQLLATGGVTCLVGYAVHRVQTIWLFVKDFSTKKLFAGLSVLALLLTSMVDCHFFNVGPVLLYSGILAFVEFSTEKTKI